MARGSWQSAAYVFDAVSSAVSAPSNTPTRRARIKSTDDAELLLAQVLQTLA
jgi:hypothetical protein